MSLALSFSQLCTSPTQRIRSSHEFPRTYTQNVGGKSRRIQPLTLTSVYSMSELLVYTCASRIPYPHYSHTHVLAATRLLPPGPRIPKHSTPLKRSPPIRHAQLLVFFFLSEYTHVFVLSHSFTSASFPCRWYSCTASSYASESLGFVSS